ncbi:MAG: SGNH/GDSL hydrolase family protein [Myxococcales bacterium]|nr:SGNH/GDSL hydrolase family protein [Myxococcales bacterium]
MTPHAGSAPLVTLGRRTQLLATIEALRFVAQILLAAVAAFGALSLVVRVPIAIVRVHTVADLLRVTLGSPVTVLCLAAALAVPVLAPRNQGWTAWSAGKRRAMQATLILVPVVVCGIAALGSQTLARVGIVAPFENADHTFALAPNFCYGENRGRPPVHALMCTDSLGMRAMPGRSPAVNETDLRKSRVLLVGDSFVFGSGVADADTLANALGQLGPELQIGNFAMPGLGFSSYIRQLRAVAQRFRPDWVVVGFNKGNDVGLVDSWERQRALGDFAYLLSALLLIELDLYPIEQREDLAWMDERNIAPAVRAEFAKSVAQLAELQRELGFRIAVFSYYGPTTLFEDPGTRLGWKFTWPTNGGWDADPALHIAGDGHPTAAANRMFATEIARMIESNKDR